MVVYAEQILFDNLCVDSVLVFSVVRLLGVSSGKVRIFTSAAIGSVAALISAIFGGWVAWVLRFLTAPIMVAVMGKRYTVKKFLLALCLFLSLTFAYGGVCYMLTEWMGVAVMKKIPIGGITAGITLFGLLMFRVLRKFTKSRRYAAFVYDLTVVLDCKEVRFKAFFDSGNTLLCDGLPVILVDAVLLKPILGDQLEMDVALKKMPQGINGRWVTFATQGGGGKVFAFKPDCVQIYLDQKSNTIYDVMVGVDFIKPVADCRALMGPRVLSEVTL